MAARIDPAHAFEYHDILDRILWQFWLRRRPERVCGEANVFLLLILLGNTRAHAAGNSLRANFDRGSASL